jgi:hypothetical protein
MKTLWIAVGLAVLSTAPLVRSQPACPAKVVARVEVPDGEFSLTDLLAPDTCPALRQAAAGVALGHAPLAGSERVFTGSEVRAQLNNLAVSLPSTTEFAITSVPERIVVRRAGPRATCAEIGLRIADNTPESALSSASSPPQSAAGPSLLWDVSWQDPSLQKTSWQKNMCGGAGRIPQQAALEITKKVWDAGLRSWKVSVRCRHPGDCVPFLVRSPGQGLPSRSSVLPNGQSSTASTIAAATGTPLVRPGQTVTLTWDQGGIRLVVPAVCLDLGGPGEVVRARILGGDGGGRLMRAVVESAGRLRVTS